MPVRMTVAIEERRAVHRGAERPNTWSYGTATNAPSIAPTVKAPIALFVSRRVFDTSRRAFDVPDKETEAPNISHLDPKEIAPVYA